VNNLVHSEHSIMEIIVVCGLHSAFYPHAAFYARSTVCSPLASFYTDSKVGFRRKRDPV